MTIDSSEWFVLNGGDSTCAQLFGIVDIEHKARRIKLENIFPNGEGKTYLIGTNKKSPTVLSWEALVRFVFLHGSGKAANKFISMISRISYENLDSLMEMEVEDSTNDLDDRELGDVEAEALVGELDAEALLGNLDLSWRPFYKNNQWKQNWNSSKKFVIVRLIFEKIRG